MNSTEHVDESAYGNVMEVDLHGKLSREDYGRFAPETERMIQEYGKVRILVNVGDFEGWDAGAMWEDIKWNAQHFKDIERLAIVGKPTAHQLMTGLLKSFTTTEVRYYTLEQIEDARDWLDETDDGGGAMTPIESLFNWKRVRG